MIYLYYKRVNIHIQYYNVLYIYTSQTIVLKTDCKYQHKMVKGKYRGVPYICIGITVLRIMSISFAPVPLVEAMWYQPGAETTAMTWGFGGPWNSKESLGMC